MRTNLIFCIFIGLILCYSCDNRKTSFGNKTLEVIDETVDADAKIESHLIWDYDPLEDTIKRNKDVPFDNFEIPFLINSLNENFKDRIYLEYVDVSNDTLFVKIEDSEYLTQRMGTTGAYGYMITAVFTLTEAADINHVYFDFEFGDHAMPGLYTREDFFHQMERNRKINN